MNTENLRALACAAYSLSPQEATLIHTSPMPSDVLAWAEKFIQPKMCFDNCRMFLETMIDPGAKYCLLVCHWNIPFEHACVKLSDGTYVDPTLEIINPDFDGQYLLVREYDYDELLDIIIKLKRTPSLTDYINLERGFEPSMLPNLLD
ncbi:hypothetical protein [Vibrio owensii]|uniref:hypothetical protein n=1 Tax=Vibrio owensii TaxID=696485 RepID=UPI0040692CCB